MAHLLRITDYNGTVEFNAGNNNLLDYVPRSPDLSTIDFMPEALRDGGERLKTTRRNVTESALVILGGTSTDAMRSAVGSVESYLRQAEAYQERRSGSPVYMEFQPGGSGDVYRSEVLSGKVELSDLTLSASQWNKNKARALVAYTRRYYWEGAEGTIQLYNSAGTSTTGVTVYNCNDGTPPTGQYNYVEIAGTSVAGNYPAPIRLQITNSYNDAEYLGNVWVGHNVFANPATFSHIIEAETASSGGSSVASVAASGGYYRGFTWATDAETLAFTWPLSAALLSASAGQWFNVLAKWWLTCDTGIKYRLEIRYGAEVLWSSQSVSLDTLIATTIRSLGSVQLPPWATNNSVALSLLMYVKKTGGSTVNLDFLQLTPTDSIRTYIALAYGVPYNSRLVDDSITDSLYEDSGDATARAGFYEARGAPIMLWPGKLQRLYFLQHGVNNNSADIDRTASICVYYRPRRLTL